jgi:hypothetical protein
LSLLAAASVGDYRFIQGLLFIILALDLDIYVESGPFERGIGWIFIYYAFTFIAFESILMMTQCVIETPVEGNSFL